MPWPTPTLLQQRINARNYIMSSLPGADAMIPNSVLRVLADVNAGESHLNLQFLAWLALMFLPVTATDIWLDRWADMFLINADQSHGRKQATFASGTVLATGTQPGVVVPFGSNASSGNNVTYQSTAQETTGGDSTVSLPMIALTAGVIGNLDPGATLQLSFVPGFLQATVTVISMTGGADTETDDELRVRLLDRLSAPPMGGDASDYVQWALSVAGVTRAWSAPNEMGIGTVTIRFMMDDLRASTGGFPNQDDIDAVQAYLDTVRPVTVKDFFVEAPIATPINFTVSNLDPDDQDVWADIIISVQQMLAEKARPAYSLNGVLQPAQTIFAAWVSDAILNAPNVVSFDLTMADAVMPNNGCLATLGSIVHG